MNLLGSLTSPFVRQVRVVIAEKNLGERILLEETNPFANSDALLAANPLGKVPALVGSAVGTLHDSRLICEYLDSLNDSPQLLPETTPERWLVLRRQATAMGVMDAAAAHVMEGRREDGMISSSWQQRRCDAMARGVQALAEDFLLDPPGLDLGSIATAVALAYLDFRHADLHWRKNHGELANWLDEFAERESMQTTRPPA